MKPYYADDSVALYHGRCEDVLPSIDKPAGSAHLLTDPPYYRVKKNDWDNQWKSESHFLSWMGDWIDLAKPHLSSDASVWVFASTDLVNAVERVIAKRFRVLNNVRWVKQGGAVQSRRVSMKAQRSFVSPWEGIVFAEQKEDAYRVACENLHQEVFAPIGEYFKQSWEAAGIPGVRVGERLGYSVALAGRWAVGATLPTPDGYERLRVLVGLERLPRDLDSLRAEFAELNEIYVERRKGIAALRRPFSITDRKLLEDLWHFPHVSGNVPGKHPAEKPTELLAHMIRSTTREGDTVLDCFAGSGSTLDTARQLGRKAIGIEMDERWCEASARRLSQATFDLEGISA